MCRTNKPHTELCCSMAYSDHQWHLSFSLSHSLTDSLTHSHTHTHRLIFVRLVLSTILTSSCYHWKSISLSTQKRHPLSWQRGCFVSLFVVSPDDFFSWTFRKRNDLTANSSMEDVSSKKHNWSLSCGNQSTVKWSILFLLCLYSCVPFAFIVLWCSQL